VGGTGSFAAKIFGFPFGAPQSARLVGALLIAWQIDTDHCRNRAPFRSNKLVWRVFMDNRY
jgi:hypothetical protein